MTGTTSIGYTYDGDGYRVGATTDPADPNAYTWDRLGLGGLGQIIADDTGENVFGPAGLQQRVSSTGTPQYAHGDGLGSLRLVTDASGTSLGGATYEPWGAPRSGSATLGGYGFTGELTDAETGFVYLRARYLDPSTGRFLSEDSYGGTPGSPLSQHRFAYGNDNPLSYTDPSGHWVIVIPAAAAAAAAAAVVTLLPVLTALAISVAIVYACVKIDICRNAVIALSNLVLSGTLNCIAEAQRQLSTLFSQNTPQRKPYVLGPNDKDWRGSGKTWQQAVDEAFKETGVPKEQFVPTRRAPGPYGKEVVVEWQGPDGAEVSIDYPHNKQGPDEPHVGWQRPGKKSRGEGGVGHIILDDVPGGRIPDDGGTR